MRTRPGVAPTSSAARTSAKSLRWSRVPPLIGRLHPHRRGQRGGGCWRSYGDGFDTQVDGARCACLRPVDDRGQPARRQGERRSVRRAHVLLHPHAGHPVGHRVLPSVRAAPRPHSAEATVGGRHTVKTDRKSLSLYMLLRAFSSGAVALSGVEAVSNGVPAFKKPESKNARRPLCGWGVILGSCFLGVSVLASQLKPFRAQERRQRPGPHGHAHIRRQRLDVLADDDRHLRDPDPRGQHGVCRLPAAGLDHRQRRFLPASSSTAVPASCSPTASSSWRRSPAS